MYSCQPLNTFTFLFVILGTNCLQQAGPSIRPRPAPSRLMFPPWSFVWHIFQSTKNVVTGRFGIPKTARRKGGTNRVATQSASTRSCRTSVPGDKVSGFGGSNLRASSYLQP